MTLRERKTALSRKALLDALLDKLKHQDIEQIKISELCEIAMVSQASFYNWFPKKTDLLFYYIQLWTVEAQWYAAEKAAARPGLNTIEQIFQFTAQKVKTHPRIMSEIAAHQIKATDLSGFRPINETDIKVNFPEIQEVDQYRSNGLEAIFPKHLEIAISQGEISSGTDVSVATRLLASVFLASSAMLQSDENLEHLYAQQLQVIWQGLKSQ